MAIPSPEYEWVEIVDTAQRITDPAGGAIVIGTIRDTQIRRFHLKWDHATQAAKDAIWSEYSTAKGEAGITTYTPEPRGRSGSSHGAFCWRAGSIVGRWKPLRDGLHPGGKEYPVLSGHRA